MIIGITGGTGCGKTTALNAISQLGGTIIDCDKVYHHLLANDPALLLAIADRFPGTVTRGVLDRKRLGSIVFSDPKALKDLNAITHSAVRVEVCRILESGAKLTAIDAIELFEGNLAKLCQITVAITAPEEARIPRLMERDHITREAALQRIRAQKPESYFREKCDYILENTGDLVSFQEKCLAFFRELIIMKNENPNKE